MENKRDFWLKTGIIGVGVVLVAALLLISITQPEEPVARSYEDHVWLRKESVTVTASGTAGSATGNASTDRELHGYIYAVHLDFTSGISTTTDITVTQASPSLTILASATTTPIPGIIRWCNKRIRQGQGPPHTRRHWCKMRWMLAWRRRPAGRWER